MGLDKLLENEAQAEIAQIQAAARETASGLIAEANERAAAMLESRTRLLETQRQAGLVRARSAADLETNAARLNANEAGVKQVYEVVEQYLESITAAPEYRDILTRLCQEARQLLPDAEAVEVAPSDVALLSLDLPVRANPSIRGGVRVVARGGKSGVTNTLYGHLERVKAELAPQINRILAE